MSRLHFLISKNKEIEEVLWTFSNFRSLQGRSSQLILPPLSEDLIKKLQMNKRKYDDDKIVLEPNTKKLFLKEFNKIYHRRQYQDILGAVEKRWRNIERLFFQNIKAISGLKIQPKYFCYLTFYGGGGSFGRENQIYIRVNSDIPNDIKYVNYTIMHELLHLMFESFAAKNHLSNIKREQFIEKTIEKSLLQLLKPTKI